MQELVQNNIPLSELVIKNIHSLILLSEPLDRGIYRRCSIHTVKQCNSYTESLITLKQLKTLVKEINKKNLHPIESASLFHLRFDELHPFINGNGHTARLILNFLLMRNGYPPVNIKFFDCKRYQEALNSYYCSGSSSVMIELISIYLEEELSNALLLI
nr:Fic family protein [Paenibacillus elgii]